MGIYTLHSNFGGSNKAQLQLAGTQLLYGRPSSLLICTLINGITISHLMLCLCYRVSDMITSSAFTLIHKTQQTN